MNILAQRRKALEIIKQKLDLNEETAYDYWLDSICREILNLPKRPGSRKPYDGWMVGENDSSEGKMQVSKECVNFIKKWEGFRGKSYKCAANVWTIGYGHTHGVKPGMTISESEASEILRKDIATFASAVSSIVKAPLSQHQFDALVSFCFNVGIEAFRKSTLVKKLNQRMYHSASLEFERWIHGGGKRLKGLENRRKEEKEMFLKGE